MGKVSNAPAKLGGTITVNPPNTAFYGGNRA